jgi:two-component system, chemotaxis family, response regulator WspR
MQVSNDAEKASDSPSESGLSNDNPLTRTYPITVLLVDDQAMIGEAVRRMLASETDINYYFCPDPANVFELISKIKPTVILQDLVMPGVNGLELLKQYRSNPETANIPVIVLSSREEPKVKGVTFTLGANDYLVKLPDAIELIARIRYHSKSYISELQRDDALKELAKARAMVENANKP